MQDAEQRIQMLVLNAIVRNQTRVRSTYVGVFNGFTRFLATDLRTITVGTTRTTLCVTLLYSRALARLVLSLLFSYQVSDNAIAYVLR